MRPDPGQCHRGAQGRTCSSHQRWCLPRGSFALCPPQGRHPPRPLHRAHALQPWEVLPGFAGTPCPGWASGGDAGLGLRALCLLGAHRWLAGPHLRVPVARQSRGCLETSHKDPRPSSLGSSAPGGPAEKVLSQLTRPLKTALCFCSIHLFLLLTKIRAKFLLLTRLWASACVPTLPSSA